MLNLTSANPSKQPLATWTFGSTKCPATVVSECIRYLTAGQIYGKADDADGYVKVIAAILIRYPESVVRAVTHPAHGLPVQLDWLPKPAEVRRACEAEMAKQYAAVAPPVPRLPEPERTAEELERVHARWLEVRAEITGSCLVTYDEPKGERMTGRVDPRQAERDAAWAHAKTLEGQPLPPLSEATRARFGLGAEQAREAAE